MVKLYKTARQKDTLIVSPAAIFLLGSEDQNHNMDYCVISRHYNSCCNIIRKSTPFK